jgi:hypothetical protein
MVRDFKAYIKNKSIYYRRWQETKNNLQSELVFSEIEWTNEWKKVVEMATTTPRARYCELYVRTIKNKYNLVIPMILIRTKFMRA